ncbi:unnamed protein product [Sphenostylis stenocarpa]|uniref:Serine aminopeptidase S33 domain-containing protein n=1 Tax=Sphenostylis stenocarpa TaxID=92480 RepID=A0AA86T780_9FABA|nr:unnamed protein product [Sphenostylis stenocarpa]
MALPPQQNPPVRRHTLTILNRHGQKLVGVLHESGTGDIDTNLILNLAVALENAKISSFRFDFSGSGESEGLFQYGNYWAEVDDLHAVVLHFRESNRVISAIVGHSKGGDIVLLYASKYRDIKTVVNLSGRYDMKAGIEERLGKDYLERISKDGFIDVKKRRSGCFDYRVTEESLMDRLGTSMHEASLQIDKECRVIIPNHKLHVIEGANHMFSNHQGVLSSVVVNFIAEALHQVEGIAS